MVIGRELVCNPKVPCCIFAKIAKTNFFLLSTLGLINLNLTII